VIGCGLGAYHGYAYSQAPEYELVAVCDLNTEVLGKFFERSRVTRGSVHEYTDYREMLEKERLDVVSVATPDDHHANPVCDASDAGVKGILCEKPLCIQLKDADRMIETVERNGTKLAVDHTRSWLPLYQNVRSALREGEIGKLSRIVAHMGGRRSMLFRNGTHLIDAVCYFAEADPVWVIAAHEQGFQDYGIEYKGEGGKDPMLDPAPSMLIEFANGVRGIINCCKDTPAGLELDLQGPGGRFRLNDADCLAWKTKDPSGTPTEAPAPHGETYHQYFGDDLIRPVQEMAWVVLEGAPSSSPARRARNSLEIMLAALLSQSRDCARISLPLPRS
jgi:predicted dehydrogenase